MNDETSTGGAQGGAPVPIQPVAQPSLSQAQQGRANYNLALDLVGIRYIGLKKVKTDNICNTDIVWNGFGDIQQVPKVLVPKFVNQKYAAVWQLATDEPPPDPTDDSRRVKAAANARAALSAHRQQAALRKPPERERAFDTVSEDAILAGIEKLIETEDPSKSFDPDGQPNIDALRAVLGKHISPAARTQAWDLIRSAQAR